MNQSLPPFVCRHSAEFSDLLWKLQCTLVISIYQANKIIYISAGSSESLVQLPQDFDAPMGLAAEDNRLAVATKDEVIMLSYVRALASSYPRRSNTSDGQYVPHAAIYCGELKAHDLVWGQAGLWKVNTLFSCLSLKDDEGNFNPRWRPRFISELAPEDRCHLNGVAMVDGYPEYVTALGETNTSEGWRPGKTSGGIVIHVPSDEVVLRGLPMPHTPRVYEDDLYVLLSATGEVARVDMGRSDYEVVTRLPGFVRGMARYGDYLFVGLSQLRRKSPTFSDIPIARESPFCGIVAINLRSGTTIGQLRYDSVCQEIYDVQALSGLRRPGLIGPSTSGEWSDWRLKPLTSRSEFPSLIGGTRK
ncbi:MAG: TIGR03032 family protein [Candidatus Poribacteria bacterium]|nr:TIGR03032 family protein [Candidatus Poribacteria bacterium]MDE0505001.1 TIGR03032 family protein [Candidatus Poribacteria bacterium]